MNQARRFSQSGLRVAVAGGGIVGACASLVFARAGHSVVWYAPPEPLRRADGAQARAYALAPDTVQFLQAMGIWNPVGPRARAVTAMEVYPRKTDPRPVVLLAQDAGVPQLAHILGHADLLHACERACQATPNIAREDRFPHDIAVGDNESLARLALKPASSGSSERTGHSTDFTEEFFDLVVATDGAGSFLRRRAGLLWGLRDYDQVALVMAFESQQPHDGVACQWFDETSVLALLPLEHDRQISMVYSMPTREAQQWAQASAQDIAARVSEDSGDRWGPLAALSRVALSPLAMTLVEKFSLGRLLLVGDAAHTVHPLAGYGLNLGMQDLVALAEVLPTLDASGSRLPAWIARFGQQRRSASRKIQWGLDGIWRAMRLEGPGLSVARRLGSYGLRETTWLRQWLIHQAIRP